MATRYVPSLSLRSSPWSNSHRYTPVGRRISHEDSLLSLDEVRECPTSVYKSIIQVSLLSDNEHDTADSSRRPKSNVALHKK